MAKEALLMLGIVFVLYVCDWKGKERVFFIHSRELGLGLYSNSSYIHSLHVRTIGIGSSMGVCMYSCGPKVT